MKDPVTSSSLDTFIGSEILTHTQYWGGQFYNAWPNLRWKYVMILVISRCIIISRCIVRIKLQLHWHVLNSIIKNQLYNFEKNWGEVTFPWTTLLEQDTAIRHCNSTVSDQLQYVSDEHFRSCDIKSVSTKIVHYHLPRLSGPLLAAL